MTIVQFPGTSIDVTKAHERFKEAMRQRGVIPPHQLLADGKIHRCDVVGKHGKADGAYLLFDSGKVPAGGFQNWKDGLGWENWHFDIGRQLSPSEQREIEFKRNAAARERMEQEKLDIATASRRALYIWSRAREETNHGYLTGKGIAPSGARVLQTALTVPARTIDGDLRGLQFIDAHGNKLWMKGSRPSGAFHQISEHRSVSEGRAGAFETVVICEGFATAATIHQATGHPTLAAFTCGNLKSVARAVRQAHPKAKIVIAADDDSGTKGNPGMMKAMDAAVAVGGLVAYPSFNHPLPAGGTDFNDLARAYDLQQVSEGIQLAKKPDELIELRLLNDPFAAFAEENINAVVELKERDRVAFERLRERLKQKGVRTSELDKLWGEAIMSLDEVVKQLEKENKKQADILVEIASTTKLFHSRDKTAYADIRVGGDNGHTETCAVHSRDFKRWLKHRYYEQTESSPSSESVRSAIDTIEAKAIYEGQEYEVYVRVGGCEGNVYIDIGDEHWRAIEVAPTGWRVISDPPVRFRRPGTMLSLPLPVPGGKIDDLRKFINVPNDDAFILTVAAFLAAMRPQGPYPVLSLHGPAGTAKSTFSEVMRRLVDPGKPALRSLPREKEDFFIAAHNNHVLAFENISYIPTWISDLMCQLSTGGGHSRREPYTAMDETVFDAQKPQVLNGIEDFVIRGDLADRAVPLVLQTIEEGKRRHEHAFWAEFDSAAPKILGALLDALSNGLKHLPTTNLEVLPRMADFAIWATACETGALWVEGRTFAAAYVANREEATAVVLEDDAIAQSVIKFMADKTEWGEGRLETLLASLTALWPEKGLPDKWPRTPKGLSNRLRRVQPQLAQVGLTVWIGKSTDRGHHALVTIKKVGEDPPGGGPSKLSRRQAPNPPTLRQPSETGQNGGQTVGACGASERAAGAYDQNHRSVPLGEKPNGISPIGASELSELTAGRTLEGAQEGGACWKCGLSDAGVSAYTIDGRAVSLHRGCVPYYRKDPSPHPSLELENAIRDS
jgi:phage/plasmid primase-like uncharacterized protein